ncbi:MAG: IPT/TIG domain-containing protein [Acidobacteriota bacterium]
MKRSHLLLHRLVLVSLVAAGFLIAACGGSPSGPTPPPPIVAPTIFSVTPNAGATAGGTDVTISGANFGTGASVTVGGVAATNVRVIGTAVLIATPGPHAAGPADVIVTLNGQSGALLRGFTYVVPPPNTPPTILSIVVQGPRANQPSNFADLNEEVVVTATIADAETPVAQLTYTWTAEAGTITSASGPVARWRAPATMSTPRSVTITLTVTEVVAQVGGLDGRTLITQNTVGNTSVSVHDSVKEIADLAYQFLVDFSNSALAPEYVVRNFYSGCSGAAEELSDVVKNRATYNIYNWKVGAVFPVAVAFNDKCPFRGKPGDGCAQVPVEWHSTCLKTSDECTAGQTYTTIGTGQCTMVYRQNRWWLCDSDFNGTSNTPLWLPPFIR